MGWQIGTRDEFNLKNELLSLFEKQYLANHGQKNIQLNLRYLVESEIIYASHFYLLGALQNLLDNAVKYSGDMPQITVICYQKRGTFVIEIRDNGPGIPPEIMNEIFVPFFTTKEEGSGIGLSVSRQIMRMHGGNLKASSIEGKETVFTIIIWKWWFVFVWNLVENQCISVESDRMDILLEKSFEPG